MRYVEIHVMRQFSEATSSQDHLYDQTKYVFLQIQEIRTDRNKRQTEGHKYEQLYESPTGSGLNVDLIFL